MSEHKEIRPEDFRISPFQWIGADWMAIAAEREGRVNTMTASWGGMGVLWNRDVAFIFIRPQRYTKEFVDNSATFSCNFLPSGYRRQLEYLGSASGRDEDKIARSGLTVERLDGTPYFAQSRAAVLCRKLYAQPLEEKFFIDHTPDRECYPDKDYHTFYIGEITHLLAKPGSLD